MNKNTLKTVLILLTVFISTLGYSQKLVKIKGSKIVTTTEINLDSIVALELFKNIELTLTQGDEDKLTIYADDNLHDVLDVDLADGKLSLSLLNRITSKKKFELSLQLINLDELILNSNSKLMLANHFNVDSIKITLNDKSQADLFFNATNEIIFFGNDKSKAEVSLKSTLATFNFEDSAKMKGSSVQDDLHIIAKDKPNIVLSGTCDTSTLNADDSSHLKLTNLISDKTDISANGKSVIQTNTTTDLSLNIKDTVKIYFYGKAKILIKGFSGMASIFKKE